MVSKKQLVANRENAKLGGVKTIEGKEKAKYNAITHGLLIKQVLVKGEDAGFFKQLTEQFMVEMQPQTEFEVFLIERIVSCIWRLRRVLRVEKNYISDRLPVSGIGDWTGIADFAANAVASWQSMNRYETAIERQLYKAWHELERLQSARRGENPSLPLEIDVNLSRED